MIGKQTKISFDSFFSRMGFYSIGRMLQLAEYDLPNGTIGRKTIIASKKELKLFLNYQKHH
jgi:hypothetical protein